MTTTSTDGDYTRTAELQPARRADDAERDVIVTLYRDDLPVIGVAYKSLGDDEDDGRMSETERRMGDTGRRHSAARTYTDTTQEAVALTVLTVEVLLTARAAQDVDVVHDYDPVVNPMVADGQAATWLEEDFA